MKKSVPSGRSAYMRGGEGTLLFCGVQRGLGALHFSHMPFEAVLVVPQTQRHAQQEGQRCVLRGLTLPQGQRQVERHLSQMVALMGFRARHVHFHVVGAPGSVAFPDSFARTETVFCVTARSSLCAAGAGAAGWGSRAKATGTEAACSGGRRGASVSVVVTGGRGPDEPGVAGTDGLAI